MSFLVASPKTRKLAVEALGRSATERPFNKALCGGGNGGTLSIKEWHDYSHDLIASIQKLERG